MDEPITELSKALSGLKDEMQALLAAQQAEQAQLEHFTACLRRHGLVD